MRLALRVSEKLQTQFVCCSVHELPLPGCESKDSKTLAGPGVRQDRMGGTGPSPTSYLLVSLGTSVGTAEQNSGRRGGTWLPSPYVTRQSIKGKVWGRETVT